MIKTYLILTLFLTTYNLSAEENLEHSILNAIYKNLYKKPLPALKRPIQENKLDERKKNPSKGESYVQRMLRENREKIKLKNEEKKENQKDMNIYQLANKNIQSLGKKVTETRKSQAKELRKTYKRWANAQKLFLKNLPAYKEALVTVETFTLPEDKLKPPLRQSLKKRSGHSLKKERASYYIIPNALSFPVRDQGRRPTCFAFAGVRAIETKLAAKNLFLDLSEQFFYFKGKPSCQEGPCSKRGGWILPLAKKYPQRIPLEKDCPYSKSPISNNETQVPLKNSCLYGNVNIKSYAHIQNMQELRSALSQNNPVVAGVKLSPNFYRNSGFINHKDRLLKGKTDSHSKGHAILIVGHMKHPETIKNEGQYCYITANSWGQGWGQGGFSCLSERWLKQHLIKDALVSIQKVEIK